MKITTSSENLENYKTYLSIEEETNVYLKNKGYLKVDLPVLSPTLIPESYLEIFETEFTYFKDKKKLYLTPSPELFLKRILAYVKQDCYSLGKSFRNSEPDSSLHSPEFTMLEFYKLRATYMDIADEVLGLMQAIAKRVFGKNKFIYKGYSIDLSMWEKITVAEAFQKYAFIDEKTLLDHEKLIKKANEKNYRVEGFTYEDIFSQIYVQEVEPHLGTNGYATLIYDYPREFAALAKLNPNKKTAQRFEFYIGGVELGDCYTELTDPKEQEGRFEDEQKKRKETGKIEHPIDKGFIEALQYGLPPCAGIAIGFDRLAMIFAGVEKIESLKLINIS